MFLKENLYGGDTLEINTLKGAVIYVMNSMEIGERFYGNAFQKSVALYYPKAKNCYVDTVLRVARRHCRDMFRVVDRAKSLYERI